MNQLLLGDNLEIMKNMDSESIDLIYLDPPFFSNRTYEVIWGDTGEMSSFGDRFSGGIEEYITWLKERVEEMHRLLKATGSIFLHCDSHANAYIRVMILDKIFGGQNLQREIIWKTATNSGNEKSVAKNFPVDHDTIYYYSKDKSLTQYTPQHQSYSVDKHHYLYDDKDGRGPYQLQPLRNVSDVKLRQLEKDKRLIQRKDKYLQFKDYVWDKKEILNSSIWIDIEPVDLISKERVGYRTQKPLKLLERLILAASEEGNVVMDPFMGGGTTILAADRLARNWIGIDQSVQAIKISEMRINGQRDHISKPYLVKLNKHDYDTLRYKDAFEFESFIVKQYGGVPNKKQRGDLGIDGIARDGSPIQVKRSDNIGRNVIDNFFSAAQRFDKNLFERNKADKTAIGSIIAFSFGNGAMQEVARLKLKENIIINLVRVEDIIPIARRPQLTLHVRDLSIGHEVPVDKPMFEGLREIEFVAVGKSDAGIEFYSWDWDYNEDAKIFRPEIFLDKKGQQVRKLSLGEYTVAIKVVDNDGLEAVEVIRLKINGRVHHERI